MAGLAVLVAALAGCDPTPVMLRGLVTASQTASVPGTTVDRQCGSSQQAVHFAAAGLIAGESLAGVGIAIDGMLAR